MAKKIILSVQMVNGVRVVKLAPNQPKKKLLTAAIPARPKGNFLKGSYRAVKMY